MRKALKALMLVMVFIFTLTACGNTNDSTKITVLWDQVEEEKQPFCSDYVTDYLVIDGPHMDEPIVLPIEDYLADSSAYPIADLRYIDFSNLESLDTAAAWKEAADKYCLTAEDVIILKAADYLNSLKEEGKGGAQSVPLTWITDFKDNAFDFGSVNEKRLQYKLEVLAHAYGYTTCGRSGIGVDDKGVLRATYNFYSIDSFPELSPIFNSEGTVI